MKKGNEIPEIKPQYRCVKKEFLHHILPNYISVKL